MAAVAELALPRTILLPHQVSYEPTYNDKTQYSLEARMLAYHYGVQPLFIPELENLVENGILGHEAEKAGWDNIGEHCILAGKLALPISWLVGLSREQSIYVTQQAYLHDATLRREKESKANGSTVINGMNRANVDTTFYMEHELTHPGLRQATSMDWRGYEYWDPTLQIIRYVDSCVRPQLDKDGNCGRDVIQHYTERAKILHSRKKEVSILTGNELYSGDPAFRYLVTVTADIEQRLFQQALTAHPELFTGPIDDPTQFYDVAYELACDPNRDWSEYLGYDTLSS